MSRHLRTRTTTARARLLALACTPIVPLLFSPARPALADATWIATGSGLWSTAANWSSNPLVPNGQDQNVLFGNATLTPATVTLSTTPFTVGSLTFDSSSAYTLVASASNLTLSTSAGNACITVNNSYANVANTLSAPIAFASPTTITNNDLPGTSQNNLTLSGALSGSQTLTLAGPGQVVFSGTNSAFTGAISINNGTLFASSSTALGTGTSNLDGTTINANATLAINTAAAVSNEYLTLNGGTLKSNTASSVSLNRPLAITADSTITATSHSAFTLHSLTGAANLTLSTASFNLAGAGATNTFTGNVTVTSGASVNLTGSLVNSPSVTVNAGTQFTFALPVGTDPALNSLAPGTLIATNAEVGVSADIDFRPALSANSTLTGILFNTANATLAGSNSLDLNTFANPATLRLGGTGSIASTMDLRPDLTTHTLGFGLSDYAANNLTVNAPLTDHDNAPMNLDIDGGTTTLTANNTYSGTTTIANGTLVIANTIALGTASGTDADGTTINANGTLRLGANVTLSNEKITVNPGATLSGTDASSVYAQSIVSPGNITLGTATYTSTISGAGPIVLTGNATFSGSNTYSGPTSVTGSNVTITPSSSLGDAASGTTIAGVLNMNAPSAEAFTINSGSLILNAPQSGSIVLNAGNLTVNSNGAAPITVKGGIARFYSPGNVSLTATNGLIDLFGNGTYTGNITIGGGSSGLYSVTSAQIVQPVQIIGNCSFEGYNEILQGGITGAGNVYSSLGDTAASTTFNGPIALTSGSFHVSNGRTAVNSSNTFLVPVDIDDGSASFTSQNTFRALNVGRGNVTFPAGNTFLQAIVINGGGAIGGTATFAGNQTLSGGLTIYSGSAIFNGTNISNGIWDIVGEVAPSGITVNANNTISQLIEDGTVTVNAGATLTSQNPTLSLLGGNLTINGALSGVSTILKSSSQPAELIISDYSGQVVVQEGALTYYGPSTASLIVSGASDASITVGGAFNTPILLQNASGVRGAGALFPNGEITSTIDVGSIGSTIGIGIANASISGPIVGGNVTFAGSSITDVLQLTGQNNTYIGATIIANGTLNLAGGRLTSTNSIVLQPQGELQVGGFITDTIPIISNGGSLFLYAPQSVVGPYTAAQSLSTIINGNASGVAMTLTSITRSPGATLQFSFGAPPYYNNAFYDQLFLATSPALHNGLIAGWAIIPNHTNTSAPTFATYNSSGITGYLPNSSDINTATATSNPYLSSSATLATSKSVNSLNLYGATLNLGGNTLALDTGGLIVGSTTSATGMITNGTLTGGDYGAGELIVFGGGNITANIADAGSRKTSLTSAGVITLSGTNSYTGITTIDSGQLHVESAAAFPAGGDLNINGGQLVLDFSNDFAHPLVLGNVHVYSAGSFQIQSSNTYIQAASLTLEGGSLNCNFVGNGPISVNGAVGFGSGGALTNYQGNITINNGGILTVDSSQIGATVTVLSGGTFGYGGNITANISLDGGSLQSNADVGLPYGFYNGSLSIAGHSALSSIIVNTPVIVPAGTQIDCAGLVQFRHGITETSTPTTSGISVRNFGTLEASFIRLGTLSIDGEAQLTANGATSQLNSLRLAGTTDDWVGALDVTNNKLIIQAATDHALTVATLRNQILFGETTTAGIYSSKLPSGTVLAILDNGALATPLTTFGGLQVDASSILIAPEYPGDANADGHVDLNDLNTVLNHLGQTTPNWTDGNFDYATTIDLNDLNDVLNNLGTAYANNAPVQTAESLVASGTPTPEPASLATLLLLAPALLRRRRH